jgi:hypothetical protein
MAMAQPHTLDSVPKVMAVLARMEPATTLLAPRVAAVPRALFGPVLQDETGVRSGS